MVVCEEQHHAENLVVYLAGRQVDRHVAIDRLGLQEQPAGRGIVAVRTERHALLDVVELGHHFVEEAAGLARVARDFAHALLVVVEFFQGGDRHEDVVLLEAEQAGRVVHQHVGVEDEKLGLGGRFAGHGQQGSTGMC
jgi:hypothetical protein